MEFYLSSDRKPIIVNSLHITFDSCHLIKKVAKLGNMHPLLKMPAKQKHHTVRFEMLLTPELAEHWEALAESNGISKAELVRRRMAGYRIKSIPQVNWKCYWQLLKISENINQIAKTQNAATIQGVNPPPIDHIPFEELKIEISKLRLQLILGNDEATENELKTAIIEK